MSVRRPPLPWTRNPKLGCPDPKGAWHMLVHVHAACSLLAIHLASGTQRPDPPPCTPPATTPPETTPPCKPPATTSPQSSLAIAIYSTPPSDSAVTRAAHAARQHCEKAHSTRFEDARSTVTCTRWGRARTRAHMASWRAVQLDARVPHSATLTCHVPSHVTYPHMSITLHTCRSRRRVSLQRASTLFGSYDTHVCSSPYVTHVSFSSYGVNSLDYRGHPRVF